jgi:predicted aspartyl protease
MARPFSKTLVGLLSLMAALALAPLVQAGTPQAIPLDAVQAGTFYLKARLDQSVHTDMLLDTGSGYVSLSSATFARVKDDPSTVFLRHITGVMANGRSMRVPVYSIAELQLSEQCVLRDVEVAVMKGASRDILGLSALRQMQPLTLQMEPPVLTATCG